MKCAWNELISVLPQWLRPKIPPWGQERLQEIRLRLGYPPELISQSGGILLSTEVAQNDLLFVINAASRYSPWVAATMSQGYVTAPGGHRIGVCGEAIQSEGEMSGIRNPSSLCIRVARDVQGIAEKLGTLNGSVLIIGRPGSGKTTMLRDLIRIRSRGSWGSIAVVDERGEIFPSVGGFEKGQRTDVLYGCGKEVGVDILLRTMGPASVAVDEITSERDCVALRKAGWCGVDLIATAHAASKGDLYRRAVYQPLVREHLFDHLVILQEDKSCILERMES
jgi:stage III sporulation protein AA